MIRSGLRIKHAKFIYCFILIFMCAALPLSVQAVEEEIASPPVSVKVYSDMSENSNIAANLIAGNTFQVIEKVSDDEGIVWYRIRMDFGAEGYVRADEAKKLSGEKQVVQQATAEKFESPESYSTDENDSGENQSDENSLGGDGFNENDSGGGASDGQKKDETGGEVVALANLNLRSMPSARSKVISKVKQGVRLKYFEKLVNDSGESWYKVEYDGMEGYVIAKAVKLVKAQHSEKEEAESETRQATEYADSKENTEIEGLTEENSEMEALTEENLQNEMSVQEEQQPESQSENLAQFEVEEPTVQREHHHRTIDWMLVVLITGGLLCITAIVVFLMKIRKLRRK